MAEANCYSTINTSERRRKLIEPLVAKSLPIVNYTEVEKSDEGLFRWMKELCDYGVCILTDVPPEKGQVVKVAEKIGYIQETAYGRYFDVASYDSADLAYTDSELLLHSDQQFYSYPPGIQLLHFLKFDDCVEGGINCILDSFPVLNDFRKKFPQHFETLTKTRGAWERFHLNEGSNPMIRPTALRNEKYHISLDSFGDVNEFIWHQGMVGPVRIPEGLVEPYYDALCCLAREMNHSPYRLSRRMKVGEVLTFNNRRVLHERSKYTSNGGERHLQGTYVGIDEFKSTVQYLALKYDKGYTVKRVYNGLDL